MKQVSGFSITGAVAIQSQAHDRLTKALAENRAVEIWMGDCRVTTCESLRAAQMWVGKSKKYCIVQQAAA